MGEGARGLSSPRPKRRGSPAALGLSAGAALLFCALPQPGWAWDWSAREWLPPSREIFRPLAADPKELGFHARWTMREAGRPVGDVGMGDYLGILRVPLGAGVDGQAGLGGGVIARFNVSRLTNDFEVADFTFGLPFDFRRGIHTFRVAYWHVSSHVGDDFVKRYGAPVEKNSTDESLLLYAVSPVPRLRLYGGWAYAYKVFPDVGRNRLQAGFEAGGPVFLGGTARTTLALDLQGLERTDFEPALNARLGLRLVDEQKGGAVGLFLDLFNGPLFYQYRHAERETHLSLGLRVEMGGPVP